jgi:heat shock protein HslJ
VTELAARDTVVRRMKTLVALPLVALVGACMPIPAPPPPPYHAVGTEPFWNLLIDEHNLTFTLAGSQPVLQPTPQVIHGFAGEIYQTSRINVNIVHGQCSDGMSDRTFPDKVQVTVDGHRFNGCGGL